MAKKSGVGNLARIALNAGRLKSDTGSREVVDIITFIESDWGLNMTLFPIQKIILKAHYGIVLDDDPNNTFRITDFRRQNAKEFTEAGYLRWLFDQGRSNISEVIAGHERRNMILSIGRRSGKCVTGDTLVLTNEGVQRIEDLGDVDGPEMQPLKIGVAQEAGVRSESAYFYNGGVKATVGYETRCGYRLEGTPNHRVRVMGEDGTIQWRYLGDLQAGDQIGIHRTSEMWASEYVDVTGLTNDRGRKDIQFPERLTEQWGLLLGALVGDGGWTNRMSVSMTIEHHETWMQMYGLFTELLGEQPSVTPDQRTEHTGALRVHSVAWREFLHELGFNWDAGRYGKSIPWSILKSPKPVVCAFLKGLFETDGGVESGGKTVSFCTASGRLAREVQTLLTNMGIVSRVKPRWNTTTERHYYHLNIRGLRSRQKFADQIGFLSQKKMEPLLASLEAAGKEGGDTESIPHQKSWARKLLHSVPKANPGQGWSRSTLRKALGNICKPSSEENITYPRLLEALRVAVETGADAEVIKHFETIQAADYFFDPVVEMWEGEEQVFDLNVPDGASFVANGMTNHNTTISACIAAYETYKLINKGYPQRFYGLTPNSMIQLISVATGKDQAGLLYQEVSGHFAKCSFFKRYTANHTMSYARFQTPNDIDEFGPYSDNPKARASIKVTFAACNAKGLRGAGNIVIILDEVAHFIEQGGSSADQVYDAVSPSAATFTPKNEMGKPIEGDETQSDGRIILISSPLGKQGLFYKLFELGKTGGDAGDNMLCIQAPTWEVNPTVPASVFKEKFAQDRNVFFTEFGGEFTDRTLGWIDEPEDLYACIDPSLKPRSRGDARRPYFVGFDLGLVNDASAIAIVHLDAEENVVLDYIGKIKAGEGDFVDQTRLDFDAVANWIHLLSRRFYFHQGMFDMWNAIPLEQALAKKGLEQMKGEHFTAPLNSMIYQNFKALMWDKRLRLYDIQPKERERIEASGKELPDHLEYIEELKSLQAEYKSKYVINVQAPQTAGKHDDLSDALVRAVWLASQSIGATRHFAGTRNQDPNQRAVSAKARRRNHRMRLLGGSDPKRQIQKKRR